MNKAGYPLKNARRIFIIVALIAVLTLIKPAPVYALSIDDYFSYSYTIQLSDTEVYLDEAFSATVSGQAVCKNNLPFGMTPNAASITSRVTARHDTSGDEIVLNSGYTVYIDSFPGEPGESIQDTVVVPLAFPRDSQPGTYTITGEIITAKVRVSIIWLDVTGYLPSSQTIGNITCFSRYISDTGEFLMKYTAKSTDSGAAVTFQLGTVGHTLHGEPLSEITVTESQETPPPPVNAEIIGPGYDFGPGGAGFDQPAFLRLSYDQTWLPENVAEKNLVIAVWNNEIEEWAQLDSNVDPVNNFITTEVTHFSLYTILAYNRPASFNISNLSISPRLAASGEKVIISIIITNTGDLTAIYQLELKINGEVYYIRSARLDGGDSVTEPFSVYWDTPGIHTVDIGDLSGTFTIEERESTSTPSGVDDTTNKIPVTFTVDVTPVETGDNDSIVIRTLVTNTGSSQDVCRVSLMKNDIRVETREIDLPGDTSQEVVFATLQDTSASYTVEITGPAGVFTIEDMPPTIPETPASQPTATLNWWLVGGIGALCLILATFLLIIIRRTQSSGA